MILHVAKSIRIPDAGAILVNGSHQRGIITIQGQLPKDSPLSMELDVDGEVRPEDVEPERGDPWEVAHPAPKELLLRGVLRRFEDGAGLLQNPDGVILLDFCEDFPGALVDIPVRVRFADVHAVSENM